MTFLGWTKKESVPHKSRQREYETTDSHVCFSKLIVSDPSFILQLKINTHSLVFSPLQSSRSKTVAVGTIREALQRAVWKS